MERCRLCGENTTSEVHRLDNENAGLREALWLALLAMGREGANANIQHPLRPAWEQARAALAHDQ